MVAAVAAAAGEAAAAAVTTCHGDVAASAKGTTSVPGRNNRRWVASGNTSTVGARAISTAPVGVGRSARAKCRLRLLLPVTATPVLDINRLLGILSGGADDGA